MDRTRITVPAEVSFREKPLRDVERPQKQRPILPLYGGGGSLPSHDAKARAAADKTEATPGRRRLTEAVSIPEKRRRAITSGCLSSASDGVATPSSCDSERFPGTLNERSEIPNTGLSQGPGDLSAGEANRGCRLRASLPPDPSGPRELPCRPLSVSAHSVKTRL